MSALPFSGSALPYGSAYPAPVYGGSALPPMYPTSYPSYDAGYQSYPTVSAPTFSYTIPEATPIPTPAVFTTSQKENASERRKRTQLEEQLESVKELEKQLEESVHKLEMEHVKLNQKHSSEYNALFQKQTSALTEQNQKVINLFNEVPEKVDPPAPLFVPTNSNSQPTSKQDHPMKTFQELKAKVLLLRRKYDDKVRQANQNR